MILFLFEGRRREPDIFRTLQRLFFPKLEDRIVCSYGNNLYALYQELETYGGDGDIVALLKDKFRNDPDSPFRDLGPSSDFSEIYLFFDYDFQNNHLTLDEINARVAKMLATFDNETEQGKLYINYPMVESIRYTRELPDPDYWSYTATREESHNFKHIAATFSAYRSLDFILLDLRRASTEEKHAEVRKNWDDLSRQNIEKANYICHGRNALPLHKGDVSQSAIFESQLRRFISASPCSVAILNAFPLFLYDYFKDFPVRDRLTAEDSGAS